MKYSPFVYKEAVQFILLVWMMLSENGVIFTPQNFRALSVLNLRFPEDGCGGSFLFGFPAKLDGNKTTALAPPFDYQYYRLTMGKKGLDIGSLITNVPNTINLSFELLNNISETSIVDTIPDLFITQEAAVSSENW